MHILTLFVFLPNRNSLLLYETFLSSNLSWELPRELSVIGGGIIPPLCVCCNYRRFACALQVHRIPLLGPRPRRSTLGTWTRSRCASKSGLTCRRGATTLPTDVSRPCSQRYVSRIQYERWRNCDWCRLILPRVSTLIGLWT